jgi:hypothetical protein
MVRVDVPLRTTCAFLFVDADPPGWDPWWMTLYEHLVSFVSPELVWKHEPVQDVYVARPDTTEEQRRSVVRFLRTAPVREVDTHRTLRRAVALSFDQEPKIAVVYPIAA